MLVGFCGRVAAKQAILSMDDVFVLDKKGGLNKKHIVKEIIPRLIHVLTEHDLIIDKECDIPQMQCQILLAQKDELYEICANFAVYKYETFQAVGPDSDYVQFILESTKKTDDINKRIVKALDVAAEHSRFIGAPYLLINTKTKAHRLIRRDNV
jgi:hypothetical protein